MLITRYIGKINKIISGVQAVCPASDIRSRPSAGCKAVGLGSDDTPEYCRAASGRIMRQRERSDLCLPPLLIAACPEGIGLGKFSLGKFLVLLHPTFTALI